MIVTTISTHVAAQIMVKALEYSKRITQSDIQRLNHISTFHLASRQVIDLGSPSRFSLVKETKFSVGNFKSKHQLTKLSICFLLILAFNLSIYM